MNGYELWVFSDIQRWFWSGMESKGGGIHFYNRKAVGKRTIHSGPKPTLYVAKDPPSIPTYKTRPRPLRVPILPVQLGLMWIKSATIEYAFLLAKKRPLYNLTLYLSFDYSIVALFIHIKPFASRNAYKSSVSPTKAPPSYPSRSYGSSPATTTHGGAFVGDTDDLYAFLLAKKRPLYNLTLYLSFDYS
jgi:hypothetical protein